MTSHSGKTIQHNRETPIQQSFLAAGRLLHAALSARVGHIKLPAR